MHIKQVLDYKLLNKIPETVWPAILWWENSLLDEDEKIEKTKKLIFNLITLYRTPLYVCRICYYINLVAIELIRRLCQASFGNVQLINTFHIYMLQR